MESYLTGRPSEPAPVYGAGRNSLIPQWVTLTVLFALLAAVIYLLYDNYQFQKKYTADLGKISDQIKALESRDKIGEAHISSLKGELSQAFGTARQEIKKSAQQIQAENLKSKAELNSALATKADASHVEAIKQDAESKIGQVSSEVGGVKTEVGTVKTDLASTKHDLEGTQRQLLDVRETLTAAVAKNASELSELRRKGERDYFEFEIPKKNLLTKVEDIRLLLTKTDAKKGKYSVQIVVDDNKLEKRDRTVNEPVQFLVGRNRLRYELVVNWVQKDKVGGYLSIPKDKALAAEKALAK
jgi:chromosome segregation ATPase